MKSRLKNLPRLALGSGGFLGPQGVVIMAEDGYKKGPWGMVTKISNDVTFAIKM